LVGDHFLLSGLRPWDNIYNVCVVIAVDMVTLLEILGLMLYLLFSVENPEGKRQLGRPRRRWEDEIRMDLW
jgi:hypothetical protein